MLTYHHMHFAWYSFRDFLKTFCLFFISYSFLQYVYCSELWRCWRCYWKRSRASLSHPDTAAKLVIPCHNALQKSVSQLLFKAYNSSFKAAQGNLSPTSNTNTTHPITQNLTVKVLNFVFHAVSMRVCVRICVLGVGGKIAYALLVHKRLHSLFLLSVTATLSFSQGHLWSHGRVRITLK